MMSAVMICTSSVAACFTASGFTFTSKARITAYSGCFFSFMMHAFLTSFFCTSPMPMSKTGIFMSDKKESKASKEPKVLAFTYTPAGSFSIDCKMLASSGSKQASSISAFTSSRSSSGPTTRSSLPAMASSKPGAQILMPMDVLIFSWCTYSLFTRISFIGCGVSKARIVVTIGPLMPAMTIWSPFRKVPFTRMTSIVVPRPSMFFTSMTVHVNSSSLTSISLGITVCALRKAM
mmetsp:Transcript_62284/g.157398  ORF Transcript_62284/g.157398 Transcript_62284/m.157398 type:complete len:234 (-) Transcript_62284:3037-3738(-)